MVTPPVCASGVPYRLVRRFGGDSWEPDEEACPDCRRQGEAQREAAQALVDAFTERAAERGARRLKKGGS